MDTPSPTESGVSATEESGSPSLERLQGLLAAARADSESPRKGDGASGTPERSGDDHGRRLEAALEQLPAILQEAVAKLEERNRESLERFRGESGDDQEDRLVHIEARLDELAEQLRLWRATRTDQSGGANQPGSSVFGKQFLFEVVLALIAAASFLTVLWSLLMGPE